MACRLGRTKGKDTEPERATGDRGWFDLNEEPEKEEEYLPGQEEGSTQEDLADLCLERENFLNPTVQPHDIRWPPGPHPPNEYLPYLSNPIAVPAYQANHQPTTLPTLQPIHNTLPLPPYFKPTPSLVEPYPTPVPPPASPHLSSFQAIMHNPITHPSQLNSRPEPVSHAKPYLPTNATILAHACSNSAHPHRPATTIIRPTTSHTD